MPLLIDGYNLLHVTDIFGSAVGSETALHASRQALLAFLAAAIDSKSRRETTIVFDAAGAPPGLPQTMSHEDMVIQFARRQASADELIEDLIDAHPAPKSLTVVSSDHRVQRAARRRGATYVDSDRWYADRKSSIANAREDTKSAAKPPGKLPPDQVDYWLRKFTDQKGMDGSSSGEAPQAEATTGDSIFPPGYAEDLLSDES
jgi:uncharacterized protein